MITHEQAEQPRHQTPPEIDMHNLKSFPTQLQLLSIVVLCSRSRMSTFATIMVVVTANHKPAPLPTSDAQPTPLMRALPLRSAGVGAGQRYKSGQREKGEQVEQPLSSHTFNPPGHKS